MTVEQLRAHFGAKNNLELSKKINFARSTLTNWEQKGIPPRTQAAFQVLTGGKLKANLESLSI